MYYVYVITNLINNKKYIGMSINKKSWYREHYYGSGKLIKQAIVKYGKENFKKEIIKEFQNEIDTRDYERYLIQETNAVDDYMYYNLCCGGYGGAVKGHIVTEETRQKISNNRKGIKHTKETKKIISLKTKGINNRNQESLNKMSNSMKEHWSNLSSDKRKEIGEKISLSNKGKTPSDETREKLSKCNATLTKEQVIEIFNIVVNKEKTYKELSIIYGINQSCICDIIKKRSYKWVWN